MTPKNIIMHSFKMWSSEKTCPVTSPILSVQSRGKISRLAVPEKYKWMSGTYISTREKIERLEDRSLAQFSWRREAVLEKICTGLETAKSMHFRLTWQCMVAHSAVSYCHHKLSTLSYIITQITTAEPGRPLFSSSLLSGTDWEFLQKLSHIIIFSYFF